MANNEAEAFMGARQPSNVFHEQPRCVQRGSYRRCSVWKVCILVVIVVVFGWQHNESQHQCNQNFRKSSHQTSAVDKEPSQQNKTLLNATIYLNNSIGYDMLANAIAEKQAEHYFALLSGFDTQTNQMYCAVAAVATVLNSLRRHKDVMDHLQTESSFLPSYATQEDVFNSCTNEQAVLRDDEFDGVFAFPYGLNMYQTSELLKCHLPQQSWGIRTQFVNPDDLSLEQMREELARELGNSSARVLVNFHRSGLFQKGGGHVSPLAAYSKETDSFLVLDVSKYKYPPVWAPSYLLFQAMSFRDSCGKWNFPSGQNMLPENLLYPRTRSQSNRAYQQLECQETTRGYIVLSRR